MDLITIIAIAFGLSFDTFAASLIFGITQCRILFKQAVRVASVMALIQGGLTVAGFFLGSIISGPVKSFDHWIAFAILMIVGVRMIAGGLSGTKPEGKRDYTRLPGLLAVAVGTSIDAAATGVSFALLEIKIWLAGSIIAFVTFLASMTAIRIGKAAGERAGQKTEIAGGLILIAIGIKILLEHLA